MMGQEQVEQGQKPEFLAWVRDLRARASGPPAEDGGRTWVPIGGMGGMDDS